MRAKYTHPFQTCNDCKAILAGDTKRLEEHLHDLHDPWTSCIYCHRRMRKSEFHTHAMTMEGCERLEERCEHKVCDKFGCLRPAAKIFDTRFYCLEHWDRLPYLPSSMFHFDEEYHKRQLETVRKWTLEP